MIYGPCFGIIVHCLLHKKIIKAFHKNSEQLIIVIISRFHSYLTEILVCGWSATPLVISTMYH